VADWCGEYLFDGDELIACVDPYGRVHPIEEMRPMELTITEETPVVTMSAMMSARYIVNGLSLGSIIEAWWYTATPEPVWDEVRRLLREKGQDMFRHGSDGDRIVMVRA
jgi:hypothetical protein